MMGTRCWQRTGTLSRSSEQSTQLQFMQFSMNTGVKITTVTLHYVKHMLCCDGVNLCLFQLTFVNRFWCLMLTMFLFTKQNALEISSCGREWLETKKIKIKQSNIPKLWLGLTVIEEKIRLLPREVKHFLLKINQGSIADWPLKSFTLTVWNCSF